MWSPSPYRYHSSPYDSDDHHPNRTSGYQSFSDDVTDFTSMTEEVSDTDDCSDDSSSDDDEDDDDDEEEGYLRPQAYRSPQPGIPRHVPRNSTRPPSVHSRGEPSRYSSSWRGNREEEEEIDIDVNELMGQLVLSPGGRHLVRKNGANNCTSGRCRCNGRGNSNGHPPVVIVEKVELNVRNNRIGNFAWNTRENRRRWD